MTKVARLARHWARGLLLMVAFGMAGCTGSGERSSAPSPETPEPPASSPTPAIQGDYCSAAGLVGDLRRDIRKGTETSEELIARTNDLQVRFNTYAEGLPRADAAAVRDVADAAGRLGLAIERAGADYPYDRLVKLSSETVAFRAFATALGLGCVA